MVDTQTKIELKSRTGTQYVPFLAFPLGLLWMELIIKLWDFQSLFNRGLIYTTLFTVSIGIFFTALCMLGSGETGRRVSLVIMGACTLLYIVQAVHYTVMKTVLAVYSVSVATDATEFWRIGLTGALRTLPAILLLAAPLVLFCKFGRRYIPEQRLDWRPLAGMVLLSALVYITAILALIFSNGGIMSPWSIYRDRHNPELSVSNFGVLTSFRLDIQRMIFPAKESVEVISPAPGIPSGTDSPPPEGSANVMDIDFAALAEGEEEEALQSLHRYFATRAPSMKNEYTGLLEGKNLIMITAEAFSSWAVDENLTPTLYRLSREGFVCKNFYTPLWWVSTSDGEYVTCTSLIPKSGEQSFAASAESSLYFSLGNQLRSQGYDTRAYHNHTYTYYQRDKTHPNMGYLFKGVGNGLDVSPTWPESDVEMMELSLPEYVGNAPFHAYYMTVSGHLQYSFEENDIAAKHRDKVEALDLSEESKAYLACQIELDLALEALLLELEEAGQLENTVICLYSDHYPYGLTARGIEELDGPDVSVQGTSDLFRSTMILWSGDMEEAVVIDKPCSNLDILPTLSNLFGLEFDSRLMMGRDILSDDPGLVMFSDTSYITDMGEYNAKEDVFTPAKGVDVPEWYPREMLQLVQDKFLYSGKILMTDYYRVLGLEPAA